MKKQFIIYISLTILFTLFNACDDSLDRLPLDRPFPEGYFKTEQELEMYTNQFYTYLPSAGEIYTESVDNIVRMELTDEVRGSRTIPGSGGGWNWSQLRTINECMVGLPNCTDDNIRNKYEAITRFFRAYFYFEKVKRFGDVPWYDKPLGSASSELFRPRDSRELIMTKILEDLDFAIEFLPVEKKLYKISRWTALALKSRVCLFEGTFRKYHQITLPGQDYNFYLEQAYQAADEFMTNSGYKLFTSNPSVAYRDLFASLNANPDEVILARDYNGNLGFFHDLNNYTLSTTMGRPGLSKKIINSYLTNTGTRYTDIAGYETKLFKDECKNRDPRLSQTIRTPGYTRIGSTAKLAPNLASSITGYQLIKGVMESTYDLYQKSSCDIILFRTAEVLLNYAEAKAELGILTQADINRSVKLIRDRVGMPNLNMDNVNANPDPYLYASESGYPNVEQGTYKGVILEIRRERTIELIMEGFRYYDLMRWKEGQAMTQPLHGIYIPGPGDIDLDGDNRVDVCFYTDNKPPSFAPVFIKIGEEMTLSNGNNGYLDPHKNINRTFQENKDYYYPIPVNDRLLTEGVLTQNPNWNDGLNF
jgi:hypothetical protein